MRRKLSEFLLLIALLYPMLLLFPLKGKAEVLVSADENAITEEVNETAQTQEEIGEMKEEENSQISQAQEDEPIFDDTELVLEIILQGDVEDEYMYAYNDEGTVYISLSQLASTIGLIYTNNMGVVSSHFSNDKSENFVINLNNYTAFHGQERVSFSAKDYKDIDDTMFFETKFLERLYGIKLHCNFYEMQIKIDWDKEFPTMVKRNAGKRRQHMHVAEFADKSFKGFEFDNRWFGMPVVDLTLGKSWSHAPHGKTSNGDNYSLNISALAGGLDVTSYIYGSSYDDHKPQMRFSAGRTFLDEPPNKLNLKQFEIGDINGVSNTFFAASTYGRGVTASSFKNLVMSADKTIDIVGPLSDGWEVELYWNNQLVGYRQSSVAGKYNFPNIPVSYGLNVFELVFYGPYGESYVEEKRYYSGTSPVKKGEFGYNFAAYQPWRYLFEENEPSKYEGKDIPIVDATVYYGLSDNVTLMGGLTQTPDAVTRDETQKFGMVGVQYALSGSSFQYNLEHNFDNSKTGHHFELQGDVYYGSIYAMYDYYNGLHSPLSYYGGDYLKTKAEIRYSANLWNIPYYLSYRVGKREKGHQSYEDIVGRISKNLTSRLYASLEDSYNVVSHENILTPSLYLYWDDYALDTVLTYRTNPDPEFTDFSTKLSWRQDKYTYYSAEYRRNIKEHMDYYEISASRLFKFGGLSLSMAVDKKGNFSTNLNYNISFSKEPDRWGILTSVDSKLSSSGSIYAKLHDDDGNPLEGVGITVNNMVREHYTDEEGKVFLTDLMANDKTILNIDMDTIGDVSLMPDEENKKLVLRPGTLKELDIEFKHYGMVEGQLDNPSGKRMYGYKISLLNDKGEEKVVTFADLEGYFIMSEIPYGKFNLIVSKDNKILAKIENIEVGDKDVIFSDKIKLKEY